jgi:hypothetical protein
MAKRTAPTAAEQARTVDVTVRLDIEQAVPAGRYTGG